MRFRNGKSSALASFVPVGIFNIALSGLLLYLIYPNISDIKGEVLITLTLFAIWRYGWMLLNYIRAFIYRFYMYPKLKAKIDKIPLHHRYPKHIYFMIPSYQEEFWVSVESMRSIMNEVQTIPSDVTIVISTSTSEEDAKISEVFKAYKQGKKAKLIFQHQSRGKRISMGHALREISRDFHKYGDYDPNSITIFMDGDSYLEKDFLKKLIPFFAIDRNLGAVTTNESAVINSKNRWYKEWFNLKFGQRHIQFQAHSLSNKVMTLTGRLSAYRTDIVIRDEFINLIENDILIHPLHGKFRFLMGDDKSSWFYLLKNKFNMLYLPDVLCYSIESRDGNFFELSRSLPFRWNGNSLRNNARALKLGMKTTGLYIWFVILDQRLNMWSSLVGIGSAIILGIFKSIYYLLFYIVWVLFLRTFQLFVIALGGHPVSIYSFPIMIYTQWLGALIKIDAFYDLANQKWSKNGQVQSADSDRDMIINPLVNVTPKVLKYNSLITFVLVLMFTHGVLSLPKLNAFTSKEIPQKITISPINLPEEKVAPFLNDMIKNSDKKNLTIKLPQKTLHIYEPIIIDRSRVNIVGNGATIISHIKSPIISAIQVKGKRIKKIGFLREDLKKGNTIIAVDLKKDTKLSKYLLLREPNSKKFLKSINSKVWDKKYPYLRQQIVKVSKYDLKKGIIYISKPITLDLNANTTEIYSLKMVEKVDIQNLTIKQVIPEENIQECEGIYKNLYPKYSVDLVRFDYSAYSSITDSKLLSAGRHPLVFENGYKLEASNLEIDGSFNKGKKANGYLRVARTYYSEIKNSTIKNIRHLTLQWSSAANEIHDLDLGVDLNLHGGFTHDNKIYNLTFNIPKTHKWKQITKTPSDARWAPPDGNNFIDNKCYEK